MEIKLDADAVATVAATAIFDSLDEETRAGVIKDAIKYLMTPAENRAFGRPGATPLQTAFNLAIASVANQVVREQIENNEEVKAEVHKLLGPMINSVLDVEAEDYNLGLSEALGTALGNWLAEQARARTSR